MSGLDADRLTDLQQRIQSAQGARPIDGVQSERAIRDAFLLIAETQALTLEYLQARDARWEETQQRWRDEDLHARGVPGPEPSRSVHEAPPVPPAHASTERWIAGARRAIGGTACGGPVV